MSAIPFWARIVALALIAAVLSWWDFRKHGAQSTAIREYGFLFLTGVAGAIVGGANDALTSSLSPEYFTVGKELPPGVSAAVKYGMQVGFSGGAVGGAILLYFGRRKAKSPPIPFDYLSRRLWMPALGALLGGLASPFLAPAWDPFHLASQLREVVPGNRIPQFLLVWRIHAGLYAGLIAGLAALLTLELRRRTGRPGRLGEPTPP